MLTKYKNKIIDAEETENKTEQPLEEYHFSGGGEYEPITIRARSRAEAEKEWLKQRKKVEPVQKINE